MIDINRANEFLTKSEKLLSWAEFYRNEMREHGKRGEIDAVERSFWVLLSLFDSTHQSLIDASKKLSMDEWRQELNRLRIEDSLLHYLWKARNSEVHDAVLKWRPDMTHIQMRIVDAEKANRISGTRTGRIATASIFCFVYEVVLEKRLIKAIARNPFPSKKRQFDAGVELMFRLDSLSLGSFQTRDKGKVYTVEAPLSHLGNPLPPSAEEAVRFACDFYKTKHKELKKFVA